MIEHFLRFIPETDKRALPAYQTFLKSQNVLVYEKYKRFYESQGHESPGIKMLRYILSFVDYDVIKKITNNYDRYSLYLRFIKQDMDNIFTRIKEGRGYSNRFIAGKSNEYIFPAEDLNCITTLPLYTESWDIWKNVSPLKLCNHNSSEFTTNLINDQIHFNTPPVSAVFVLDTIALIFKYYIWLTHQRFAEPATELAEHIPTQLFLHKYVFCDMIWDVYEIWLLQRLSTLANTTLDIDEVFADVSSFDNEYGKLSSNMKTGFKEIHKLVNHSRKTLNPVSFFSSKTLPFGSIKNRIEYISSRLSLPIQGQYDYMRWLRDNTTLILFLKIWRLRKLPVAKQIGKEAEYRLRRLIRQKAWSICYDVKVKTLIESEIDVALSLALELR